MSVTVETRVDEPGDTEHAEEAWTLKERIREAEGVLKQRRGFFMNAYRRSTTHLLYEDETLVGFVSVRKDGYVLFLAVSPGVRGRGYGRRLVAEVAAERDRITCHARVTNDAALGFYEHVGFEVTRRVENYYEDGGDAYYLELGEGSGLRQRLSELIGR